MRRGGTALSVAAGVVVLGTALLLRGLAVEIAYQDPTRGRWAPPHRSGSEDRP
ncbi:MULTISPECIES: hypothetical protein [Saccharopolyspora]|uniref:hypothetical protein n=1 Tax=Saccharopolyspora TaxID=1835 RepID=UPI001404B3CD|nr:hypothetical protein [Saccharopolyspora elongata]